MDENVASAYLAAMIDGEGSVHHQKSNYNRFVSIWNTEDEILNKCSYFLNYLKIRHIIYKSKRKCNHGYVSYVCISGRNNLTKLYNFLKNFMCSRKLKKFESLLKSYKRKSKY